MRVVDYFKQSRFNFPLTWIGSFILSGLTWFVTRDVTETVGIHIVAKIEYSIKGWPRYWGIANDGNDWIYRPNDFIVNGFIWWVIILILLELYFRLKKS